MRRPRPFFRVLLCDVVSRENLLPIFVKFRASLKKKSCRPSLNFVKIGAISVNFAYGRKVIYTLLSIKMYRVISSFVKIGARKLVPLVGA